MLKFKKLTTDEELNLYIENFYQSLKGGSAATRTRSIPIEYMQTSEVTGAFDETGEMVAGYTIRNKLPLRLVEFVPEEKISVLNFPPNFEWKNCCELVCAWKKRSVSKADMARYIWWRALDEVLASNAEYMLGHNQSQKLDRHYGVLSPITLYIGVSSMGIPSRLFLYSRPKVRLMKGWALWLSFVSRIKFKARRDFSYGSR